MSTEIADGLRRRAPHERQCKNYLSPGRQAWPVWAESSAANEAIEPPQMRIGVQNTSFAPAIWQIGNSAGGGRAGKSDRIGSERRNGRKNESLSGAEKRERSLEHRADEIGLATDARLLEHLLEIGSRGLFLQPHRVGRFGDGSSLDELIDQPSFNRRQIEMIADGVQRQ